jgi:hypothetical protein
MSENFTFSLVWSKYGNHLKKQGRAPLAPIEAPVGIAPDWATSQR